MMITSRWVSHTRGTSREELTRKPGDVTHADNVMMMMMMMMCDDDDDVVMMMMMMMMMVM